jgi:hypothetical protein
MGLTPEQLILVEQYTENLRHGTNLPPEVSQCK